MRTASHRFMSPLALCGFALLPVLVAARESSVRYNSMRYNSEEHRLLVDRGVALVTIPAGITLPAGIVFGTIANGDDYVAQFRDAKKLAAGFTTNNVNDYRKDADSTQDNCYWTGFGQLEWNKNLYIPTAAQAPSHTLVLQSYTSTNAHGGFTMGQLAAIYGDYRRTPYCDTIGRCYLTDDNIGFISFKRGNVMNTDYYCPKAMPAGGYLQAIGSGLVPPSGPKGNYTGNTADNNEYAEAAWWGDEMMRLAATNDWHWSSAGIAWYAGMHRLALLYADSARINPAYWNKALHYEAHALHTLTDLFAFGHVVVNRDETTTQIMEGLQLTNRTSYKWMENVIAMGGGVRKDGAITSSSSFPVLRDVANDRNDFSDVRLKNLPFTSTVAVARGIKEHTLHDDFNSTGARVKNLNGDEFYIYGDGKLDTMLTSGNAASVIINAVRASVQSLFDGHMSLRSGSTVAQIGSPGSPFWAALNYVPAYVRSDHNKYFLGRWARYTRTMLELTGTVKKLSNWDTCQIPRVTGAILESLSAQDKSCVEF